MFENYKTFKTTFAGRELMVETAFGNQAVEDVVGKAVARTVFIGEVN